MKATKRILAAIIGITTVFVCVSCVRTQTAAEKSPLFDAYYMGDSRQFIAVE